MSFRTLQKILSELPGAYINGYWVAGARSILAITASIQPVALGQDMESLPEGRRLSDFMKVYTDTKLKVTDESTQPDLIVFDGFAYELVSVGKHQSGVIPHYKYTAVKAFKYTTDAAWLDGTLVRP